MEYEWNVKDKGPKGPSKASGRWSTAAVVGTMLIGATAGCERDGPRMFPQELPSRPIWRPRRHLLAH
jgi:hypothetical protein